MAGTPAKVSCKINEGVVFTGVPAIGCYVSQIISNNAEINTVAAALGYLLYRLYTNANRCLEQFFYVADDFLHTGGKIRLLNSLFHIRPKHFIELLYI